MSKHKKNNFINYDNDYKLFLGIFLISISVIVFEIALTRISSIVFTYNYAFLIVSLSILGLGCGGIFANYRMKIRKIDKFNEIFKTLSISSSFFSITLFLFIILIIKISFFLNPFFYFILAFTPFLFAGIVYSLSFQYFSVNSFRIYFFDLLGAATGAFLLIFTFKKFGGINLVMFISILALIPAFLFIKEFNNKTSQLKYISFYSILTAIIVLIFCLNFFNGLLGEIPIRNSNEKDLSVLLNLPDSKAEVVESRWSYFGRVDLIRSSIDDRVKFLFIDGASGTPMFKFNGNIENMEKQLDFLSMEYSGSLPFLFLDKTEKNSMLAIGPGGGIDILNGLYNGIEKIYGVEINKDFIDIVKDYKEYNGGIYTNFENVKIINNEGRSYIRSSKDHFDIILLNQPYTKSSRSIEGYSLTENYLFTVEAVKDYLSHLTEEGSVIVVFHNTDEVLRFIVSTLKVYNSIGVDTIKAMESLYTVGPEINPVLVIRKKPFTLENSQKIYNYVLNMKLYSSLSYIPFMEKNNLLKTNSNFNSNILNSNLKALSNGELNLEELTKEIKINIKPAKDDNPFFLKNEKGIPKNILLILVIAFLINILFIVLFKIKIKNYKNNRFITKIFYLYILLGLGFMLIEIPFFQKLILFMGSPTIALAIVISSLLLGMGLGSLFSRSLLRNQKIKKIFYVNLIISILTVTLFFIFIFLLFNLLSLSLFLRIFICSFLLIFLGLFLGIPFPTGITLTEEAGAGDIITWIYGINGTMSVLGSVISVAISTTFGFSFSLILGACCYLAAAIIFIEKNRIGLHSLKIN